MVSTLNFWIKAIIPVRQLLGLRYLVRYVSDWRKYQKLSGGSLYFRDSYPCLSDWVASTPFDAHYFFQAAWLARRLAADQPAHHYDIGSDIRMINVLSAFIPTTFLDYRPLQVSIEGLTCGTFDLVNPSILDGAVSSLSCLHVVEHVGLGRYGDSLDPEGSNKALSNLEKITKVNGKLYVSVPVGRSRICFNAHRVFSPGEIVASLSGMRLLEFSLVTDKGEFRECQELAVGELQEYGCGMFIFEKI